MKITSTTKKLISKRYHLLKKYVQSNETTDINRIDNIHCVEQFLYSEHLRLAGQVDCIVEFDGRFSIIDFKTSAKLKKKIIYQELLCPVCCIRNHV